MPLIRDGGRVRITNETHEDIALDEWFEVKEFLNWKEMQELDAIRTLSMRAPNIMRSGAGQDPNEKMDLSFDFSAMHQKMLEVYMLAWSFAEPLNPRSLTLIDPLTKDALIECLEKVKAKQMGKSIDPKAESVASSNGSLNKLGMEKVPKE